MAVVVVSAHGGFLERAVHSLDLSVCPRVVRLGQAMLDVAAGAGQFEGVSAEDLPSLDRDLDVRGARSLEAPTLIGSLWEAPSAPWCRVPACGPRAGAPAAAPRGKAGGASCDS